MAPVRPRPRPRSTARRSTAPARGEEGGDEGKEVRRWRSTPELFEEALLCRRLMLRGYKTASDLLPKVAEWRRGEGLPEPTLGQVRAGIRRVKELWEEERREVAEEERDLRAQRVAELDALIVQSQEMLAEAPPQSMNRANLVKEIRGAIMDKAKLQDLLSERVKQEVTLHDGDRALREQVEALLAARGVGLDVAVGAGSLPVGRGGQRGAGGGSSGDADPSGGGRLLALPGGKGSGEDAVGG